MFKSVQNIHFVGIGGIGMSGIAEILLSQGFNISGSDLSNNENVAYLRNKGAKIFIGHGTSNVTDADVVVYSSAVDPYTNPETARAAVLGIPIIRRAEMLAEVARLNYCLAVAGTHGKTTTTSMSSLIIINAGFDPTVIVGGRLRDFGGTNARLGNGEWTIVEADEYDRSFLQLQPTVAVINNIESEHLDIYKDFDDLTATFTQFANKVPFYGIVVLGIDDPGVRKIVANIKRKTITFGLADDAYIRADSVIYTPGGASFDLTVNSSHLGRIDLQVPGMHNIRNALASVAVGYLMNIDFDIIKSSLEQFTGVYRRFDIKGERNGILVVDDYAHHPTEIKVTLAAAQSFNRRIVAIFQPHTYTRTKAMWEDFANSFEGADIVIITGIYPARENPIEGITGNLIAEKLRLLGKEVYYFETLLEVAAHLNNILVEGDLLVTIGAGNVCDIADSFIA